MKKMTQIVIQFCFITFGSYAIATATVSVKSEVSKSSRGKLIAISNPISEFPTVFLSDGNYIKSKDFTRGIQAANELCDLSKSWTSSTEAILCIAR